MTAVASDPPGWTITLNRALSLASKGYHVFPVRVVVDPATGANTKTYVTGRKDSPVGAKWNATTDADLISSWWASGSRFADCMIGVSTEPSGVVLIDLDTHALPDGTRQDGPGEWARLHPEPYPLAAAVGHSSSGGTHLTYRADPKRPVRTTAGELAPAVDTRGIGGMFIFWATWLPAAKDLPPVPDVVCAGVPYVAPADRSRPTGVTPAMPANLAPADDVQERILYHRDVIAAAKDGHGIPTASRQAFLAGQHVGAGQVEAAWVADVLLSALEGWTWRKPEDAAKVRAQILKGIDDGAREPRPWLSETSLIATVTVLHPRTAAGPPAGQQAPLSGISAPAPVAVEQAPVPDGVDPVTGELADVAPVDRPGAEQADGMLALHAEAVAAVEQTEHVTTDGADDLSDQEDPHDARNRRVRLTSAAAIVPKRVRWLWDGRWALGSLTIVAGQAGLGKSTIVYDRAAKITRGELPGELYGQQRGVLVCATEDSWEYTIVPRLMAADADLDRIFRVDVLEEDLVTGLVLPRDLPTVAELAHESLAAALVLDPLTSRLQVGLDSHKDSETRRALEPLASLADSAQLTVVGLMHLNKGGGTDPLAALNGSTAFGAVARSVSLAVYDPDDEDRRRKLFGTPKNNLGRSDLPTLAFVTVGVDVPIPGDLPTNVGRIEWLEEVAGSIGDAMERAQQDPETRTAIGDAADWLKDYLTACGGGAESAAIKDAGRSDGHNAKTLSRALKKLGGRAESLKVVPRRTIWTLPTKTSKPLGFTSEDIQTRQQSPSTFLVSTDLTVSYSGDSGDSEPSCGGRGHLSRLANVLASEDTSAVPEPVAETPSWLAADGPDGTAGVAGEPVADVPPPCPCGRPEHLHSRGNWKTCVAGHRWHAFGHAHLDACPRCRDAAEAADAGGDAA